MKSGFSNSSFRSAPGFSSLELALVVFALSVAAAWAIPALQRHQLHARAAAAADQLRQAAAAFQACARERGDWPPADAAPGEFPAGMDNRLRDTAWSSPTPLGGHYVWKTATLQRGHRYAAAIVIVSTATNRVSTDRRQLEAVDQQIDDGDLNAGNFRIGFRNEPFFVLEH